MIVKTKRVDNKHVIVLELADGEDAKLSDGNSWDIYLAKRLANGGLERIPDNEPTIVFRGRDRLALGMLNHYRFLCVCDQATDYQLETMDGMIRAFGEFVLSHPDLMKQPGVTRGR